MGHGLAGKQGRTRSEIFYPFIHSTIQREPLDSADRM